MSRLSGTEAPAASVTPKHHFDLNTHTHTDLLLSESSTRCLILTFNSAGWKVTSISLVAEVVTRKLAGAFQPWADFSYSVKDLAPLSEELCSYRLFLSNRKGQIFSNTYRCLKQVQDIFLSATASAAEYSCFIYIFLNSSPLTYFPPPVWDQAAVICCVTLADSPIDPTMIQQRHTPQETHAHKLMI